ncbi:MaoC family dehydratase [Rhodococcus spelaei]|uniref:MaoC family dehydratase n=1 Tax=Rhodococcus spelaei TaxID=2546320 RepID=A0A541B0X2_9NOCA|nr:MaoC family dehydratase [Rhodococcus spelaei]TQF65952.1 MaoC family dehydratase [Rhodococcus spelaei]
MTTTTAGSNAARTVTMAELPELAGKTLGTSSRVLITQEQINLFADATNDHQWIHVDPARAADGPFGAPIAHGYLTLSLAVELFSHLLDVTDCAQLINYGLDKVRFPAPVPVNSSVGAIAEVTAVEPCAGGYQLAVTLTFDALGVDRPVCVAQMILRYLGDVTGASAVGGNRA